MRELIYKDEAIEAIHNLYAIHGSEGSWVDQKDAFNAVSNLPSAQPEPKWIPVSERLPESTDVWRTEYLATVHCVWWKKKTKTMHVQWENTTVRGKPVSRWIWHDRLFPKEWEIIAWMPLPEPYKEGGKQE